jgi:hypothetical protein
MQKFHADFKSVIKVFKKCTKKKFDEQVEKVHISVLFLLITFFWYNV